MSIVEKWEKRDDLLKKCIVEIGVKSFSPLKSA